MEEVAENNEGNGEESPPTPTGARVTGARRRGMRVALENVGRRASSSGGASSGANSRTVGGDSNCPPDDEPLCLPQVPGPTIVSTLELTLPGDGGAVGGDKFVGDPIIITEFSLVLRTIEFSFGFFTLACGIYRLHSRVLHLTF